MAPLRRVLHRLTKLPEHADVFVRLGLARFEVILKVLPVVTLAVIIRASLEFSDVNFKGIIASETVTPFATASMFVIALMLAGVLEDYKEAERIPANIANSMDSLAEKIEYVGMISRRKKAAQVAGAAARAAGGGKAHGGGEHAHPEAGRHGKEGKGAEEEEEEFEVLNTEECHAELLTYLTSLMELSLIHI